MFIQKDDESVLDIHRIDLPRVVIIGENVIESLGDICNEFGFKHALVVTGQNTFAVGGRRAMIALNASGVNVDQRLVVNSNAAGVKDIEVEIRTKRVDVVIGVGGGRIIDIAKLSSTRVNTPFISVPTTASHDGIASKVASIKGFNKPYSIATQSPIAIIADSSIIAKSPYRFTASGCGDIIAKSISVRDWRLAHKNQNEYYGEYAASLAMMSADLVMKSADDMRECHASVIRTLLEALVSCGVAMSIAGSSRPCSGSEHLFSHALDVIAPKKALHGEQCGVGTIMMAKLYEIDWEMIRDKLKIIGAPTNAMELGIGSKYIIEALLKAKDVRPNRYTILNEVNLTRSKAKTIAEHCEII